MKSFNSFKVIIFALITFSGVVLYGQHTVMFQLDVSDVDTDTPLEVGLRGSIAPLSWTESVPMSDPDNDGIFTAEVEFTEGETGDRLQYKYLINNTWDNDRFGEVGNRVLTLAPCFMVNPVDTWDELTEFPLEALLNTTINYDTWFWVYTISVGKKAGKSAENIIADYFNFWGNTYEWVSEPATLLYDQQFNQAAFPNGQIDIIENSSDKVVFKAKKPRVDMMNMYNMGEEFFGVTREDLDLINNVFLKLATKAKNWALTIKDEGDFEVITIER